MREILRRHDVDLIHVHNHMFDMALSGARLARQLGLPLVVTIHTIIKHSSSVLDFFLRSADRMLLKPLVIDRAEAVICPDENVRQYLAERFGRRDGFLVPYGIALASPSAEEVEQVRARYGLAGKRVIVSLGHMHAIRNRLDLIRALPSILLSVPQAVLVVVGAVADQAPVSLAQSLGLGDSVVFTGSQPHRLVPAFLALADLEAHWLNQDSPSRTSLGVASMEAMSAGKVVLAAANVNTFGPGVLESGRNVVIVEPGDPDRLARTIVDLLRDDGQRRRIGVEAAMTVAENFSWPRVAERTLDVYAAAARARSKR
jgi:glycosyltransferase involved in cell wall biosynthesis